MEMFTAQLINGLTIGSTYALVALGIVLIFSVLDVLSMTQGEIFMASAYVGFVWVLGLTGNVVLAIVGVLVASLLLGVVIERVAIRPTLAGGHMATLITTVGVGIVLTNLVVIFFGPYSNVVPNDWAVRPMQWGLIQIRPIDIIAVSVLVIGFFALNFVIQRTRIGAAVRATAENPRVASTFGINVNRMRTLTFVIGSGFAGLAAVILAMKYGNLTPVLGAELTLKALIVAVIGGAGRIVGAVIAAFGIGILEAMTTGFLGADMVTLVTYSLLLLFIILLPEGIFPQRVRRAG